MDKALLAVGQGITHLGERDPRKLRGSDGLHPLLASFLKALRDEDDPATRAYPANVSILRQLYTVLDFEDDEFGPLNEHVADLVVVAFFFLLRPAEYTDSPATESRSQAFLLKHIHLTVDGVTYNAATAPLNDRNSISRITYASLEFLDQKNAVRGELVGHKANADSLICPAKALGRIAFRLRRAKANSSTPIYRQYHPRRRRWYNVKPTFITNALRHAAQQLEPTTGIKASLVSARSLRPGGATALLCAGVDPDRIQLLGRWKSDAMFRYLRIQAATHTHNYAQLMLDHGSYTFVPTSFQTAGLPREAPATLHEILTHEDLYD